MSQISMRQCPCGECKDFHLVGIGKFVQGSGFTRAEAARIIGALDRHEQVLDLTELLAAQARLQLRMGHPTGVGEAGVKESLLHVMVEAVEALREINFKPWKAKKFSVNRVTLATELTDILQFWANAAIAMGFTAEELTDALRAKWGVNDQRIKDGDVVEVQS